ncbi:MAG: biotin/lipoyl-containing protein, partial [Nitriliruptorales bacterium]
MGQVRDFLLPDLGEGLESGEIVAWNVEVGDRVELNQEICDVETAKAVVSIPCPFAGTLVERFGQVGEELEVGQPLVRIDVEEVASADALPDEVADQLETAPEPAPAESEAGPEAGAEEAAARDVTEGEGKPRGDRQSVLVGYGASTGASTRRRRGGRKLKEPIGPGEVPGGNGEVARPLAKPPVRKLAKDLGVDLAA